MRGRMISFTYQKGISLIELMIAMTIALVILVSTSAMIGQFFRTNANSFNHQYQIESARLAFQILEQDLAQAGFWDGFIPEFDDFTHMDSAPTDAPTAIPNPCAITDANLASDTNIANLLGVPVQVYATVPTGCSSIVADKVADSDVLVVRRASNCEQSLSGGVPVNASCNTHQVGDIYLQVSYCRTLDSKDRILAKPALSFFTLRERDCSTIRTVRKLENNIYYVRNYMATAGDGIPTLVVSRLSNGVQQPAVPLVEGVEAMKFTLGLDTHNTDGNAVVFSAATVLDDDGVPTNKGNSHVNSYKVCTAGSPCTFSDFANTVSMRISLLVRDISESQGHTNNKAYTVGPTAIASKNDAFARHVYNLTVRLYNIALRRTTSE